MPAPVDPLPPLRVREQDGSPNVIPVFTIIVSNGTVTNQGGGTITLGMGTGAAGSPGASGGMAIGSGVTGGSTGAILFVDSSQNLGQNVSQFFWNNGSSRVGIGTSAPSMALDVVGSGRTSSVFVLGAQASSAGHALRADRVVTTLYPLTGGGLDLTSDRTFAVDTAFLVTSARTITAGVGLTGGGNLGADRTIDLNTGATGQYLVTSAGAVEGIAWINTAGAGGSPVYAPTGGNYLVHAADADLTNERVLVAASGLQTYTDATNAYVALITPVSVTSGGTGQTGLGNRALLLGSGGSAIDSMGVMGPGHLIVGSAITLRPFLLPIGSAGQVLGVNLALAHSIAWVGTGAGGASVTYAPTGGTYLTYAPDADLTAERILIAGTGVTVASDGTNFFTSVNTNIRDKAFTFFAAGTLSTVMNAEGARIYIPFNMELRDVRIAIINTPVGQSIIVDVNQYGRPVAAGTSMFTQPPSTDNRPAIAASTDTGNSSNFAIGTLYAGSYLGFDIDQIGTTNTGGNLTITVLARTS